MRLAQTQVWPALRYFEAIAPLTAISISASSNAINGALPPNSSDIFFIVPAHCCISNLPTSVELVKVSLRTIGFGHLAANLSRRPGHGASIQAQHPSVITEISGSDIFTESS